MTRQEIERLDRAAATAWPAERTTDIAGWIVRESGGGSRRANSVLPLEFKGGDIDTAIGKAEAHYFCRGLNSYFQVSQIAAPPDLDQRLVSRGYALEEPTLLMAGSLAPVETKLPEAVDIHAQPSEQWLAIYGAELAPDRLAAAPAVIDRVPQPRAFFLARAGDTPVATALGVIVDEVAIVECVATAPGARRQGHGLRVMRALEAWAWTQGARTIALQVTERNAAARRLYEGLGYMEASRYHYRVRAYSRVIQRTAPCAG